jgi:hypothetical protein
MFLDKIEEIIIETKVSKLFHKLTIPTRQHTHVKNFFFGSLKVWLVRPFRHFKADWSIASLLAFPHWPAGVSRHFDSGIVENFFVTDKILVTFLGNSKTSTLEIKLVVTNIFSNRSFYLLKNSIHCYEFC